MHQAIQQYINAVAEANGQTAHQGKIGMFNVSPAVSQKLRGAVRLSNAFLNQIRFVTKENNAGQTVGISATFVPAVR